ncbi:hypothetical protein GGQ99_004817 [Aminobacter niigataensis]|uniref:Uncharacterized protein n=1 Tax=Aminobacter niigataensis TaxID=83265 RepID=A0ABR6L8A0_9HYPH|nr:hypothetical protein [Aminobacter niigataensis]
MLLQVALVVSTPMISAFSCADAALRQAAETKGRVSAGVVLPDPPVDCGVREPYAARGIGVEARIVIRRSDDALDRANARGARCNGWYLDLKSGYEAGRPR